MQIWAIANQKGGVGKTTTAITLGALLSLEGEDTLLVDLDPHGSLTSYFGFDPESGADGVYTLFRQMASGQRPSAKEIIRPTAFAHLQVLTASTAMATLDRQLGTREGMGLVLKRTLQSLSDEYSNVMVDCPPMLGVLMVNALAACNRLLIPVQTEFLALKGLDRMLHTLKMIQRSRQIPIDYLIVPTLFDRRTEASAQSLQRLREHYHENLWNEVIPVDAKFREASMAGLPLPMMSDTARGIQAYRRLLQTLLDTSPHVSHEALL